MKETLYQPIDLAITFIIQECYFVFVYYAIGVMCKPCASLMPQRHPLSTHRNAILPFGYCQAMIHFLHLLCHVRHVQALVSTWV